MTSIRPCHLRMAVLFKSENREGNWTLREWRYFLSNVLIQRASAAFLQGLKTEIRLCARPKVSGDRLQCRQF